MIHEAAGPAGDSQAQHVVRSRGLIDGGVDSSAVSAGQKPSTDIRRVADPGIVLLRGLELAARLS
jgi:hypothetical protein